MRYSFLIALLACTSMSLKAQITETAPDAVKNMGLGWNLGNTLDANNGSGTDITAASYWGKQDIATVQAEYPSDYPDECYLDNQNSYASNEIAINWNAYLVALAGWVDAEMSK